MRFCNLMKWIRFTPLLFSLAAGPATQPAAPDLTPRQQNLLLQLSDAEANIQAINKALKNTGYSVGFAYDRIDSSLRGNEIMDRKGGGPVRWDEFYGKTAKDYPRTGFWDDRMDDHRPQQFAFVYKANNDQINRAKDQISSLMENQQGLLDRRQKHESDQSELWATLAWEQVKDREIEFRPLYRFVLKPSGPEAAVLRPVILFLRTADSVAHHGLDSIHADQAGTFQTGGQRMDAAYTLLQQSLADALDAAALKPDRAKEGQVLKALCKDLAEQSKVIADDYANALDRDKAREDNSKLEFRGQLQGSLSSFSTELEKLDDEIGQAAKTWGIEADKGVPTADAVQPPVAGQPAATVADVSQRVEVKFASGATELSEFKAGNKISTDRGYTPNTFPGELGGLPFTRRTYINNSDVTITAQSGSTIYLLVGSGTNAVKARAVVEAFGWNKIGEVDLINDKDDVPLSVYKQVASKAIDLTIPGDGSAHGTIVIAKNLAVGGVDSTSVPSVLVKYASGATEFDTLKNGVIYFTNRSYTIQGIPDELAGTTFTRRAGGKSSDLEIDASAGATVYLMTDSEKSINAGGGALIKQLDSAGWTRLADSEYMVTGKHPYIAVFKKTVSSQEHFSFDEGGWSGIVVASRSLALNSGDTPTAPSPVAPSSQKDPGEVLCFTGHKASVTQVRLMPDGRSAISSGEDGTICIWDVQTGAELRRFDASAKEIKRLSLAANGSRLATSGIDNTARVWDVETAKLVHEFKFNEHTYAFLSPDGQRVIVSSLVGGPRLCSASTGEAIAGYKSEGNYAADWSKDGRLFANGGFHHVVHVNDAVTSKELFQLHDPDQVYLIAFSPNSRQLLTGGPSGTPMCLWDLDKRTKLSQFDAGVGEIHSVAFAPGGRYTLIASDSTDLLLWDLAGAAQVQVFKGHTAAILGVAVSRDGKLAISASKDGTARVWRLPATASAQ